jgi:hypothetical protein
MLAKQHMQKNSLIEADVDRILCADEELIEHPK